MRFTIGTLLFLLFILFILFVVSPYPTWYSKWNNSEDLCNTEIGKLTVQQLYKAEKVCK